MKKVKVKKVVQAQVELKPEAKVVEVREVYFVPTLDSAGEAGERYERMSSEEAARKNERRAVLHLGSPWTKVDELPVGAEVYDKTLLVVGEERKAAVRRGHEKDQAWVDEREARKVKVEPKVEEKEEVEQPKTSRAGGKARTTWHDLGMCDFLRYCGSKGIDKVRAGELAVKCGFSPSPTTIAIQMKKGKDGEAVPTIESSYLAEIGFDQQPKAKKTKKTKKAKAK